MAGLRGRLCAAPASLLGNAPAGLALLLSSAGHPGRAGPGQQACRLTGTAALACPAPVLPSPQVIQGALDLALKTAQEAMTPSDKVAGAGAWVAGHLAGLGCGGESW